MISIIVNRLEKLESEGNQDKLNYLKTENESLKRDIERYPIKLAPGEKIICVMFKKKEEINYYSIICKNNDQFKTIKDKFFDKNPKFHNSPKIIFKVQAQVIKDDFQTLDNLGINNNSIIELYDK